MREEGVTSNVGSHSFSWFSDAARPNGSTHSPNCIPLSPPSTCTESHTRKYSPPTSGAGVRHDVTLQFFSGSTGWQWQFAAYTRWAVILNGDRSECVYVSPFVYVFVCSLGGVCIGWVAMGYWGGGEGLLEGGRWVDEGVGGGGRAVKIANERKLFWVRADLVEGDKGWWRWRWCD